MSDTPIEISNNAGPLTGDEIRHQILEQFGKFQPHMRAYHDYAERIAALSIEYHNTRLSETLGIPMEEGVLLTTLDARETPKTLDAKLASMAQLPDTKVKRVIFDRVKAVYYLFV